MPSSTILWMAEATLADRQILRAKLYVPRGRPGAVARSRLYARLDEGVRRDLTVVSAPAGFGKTTLLADWSRRSGLPVAWVSLDERDDDPIRFLSYLLAAIGTIHDGFGVSTRAFLGSLPSSEELEPVLTALSNEILELPHDFVLVLDDYHVLRSGAVHDALAFLLEYAPPPMRLVVAGRGSPPLPLARLRAAGRLTEIGEAELRFTLEEASDFLGGTMGLDLSGEGIAALENGTEGWIAGLQLAAHALKGREDEVRSAENFSGNTRHVFDYLAEEVLSRQPEDVREFMLKTSIVETLSAPLCKALTDTGDGRSMLERLERKNLFLVPLDEEGRYYRYHHLFAAFLRERLRRTYPGAVSDPHRRAGLWYESDDCIAGAGRARPGRRGLRARCRPDRRRDRRATQVRRCFPVAPMARSAAGRNGAPPVRSSACSAPGLSPLLGELEDAERHLRDTESALDLDGETSTNNLSDEERTMLGEVSIVRARMAAMREDAPLTTTLSNRALELLPENEVRLRGGVALELGHAYCSTGDSNRERGVRRGRGHRKGCGQPEDGPVRAPLPVGAGDWARAPLEGGGVAARREAPGRGPSRRVPSVAGIIDVGMGDLYYQRGELDSSRLPAPKWVSSAEGGAARRRSWSTVTSTSPACAWLAATPKRRTRSC